MHEKGAVLLLMLLGLMFSGTSAVLALHISPQSIGTAETLQGADTQGHAPAMVPVYLRAERDAMVLNKAKTALLAYAVTYADNYNPSGAGPGHLPCPDLDPPDDNNPRNDGPNPPCSRVQRQAGRVPRLTTATRDHLPRTHEAVSADAPDAFNNFRHLDDNRHKVLEFYPLRTHLDQQPWYQVADGFINNPLNRQVNRSSQSTLSTRHDDEWVAMLIAPGAPLNDSAQQRPSINADDYLEQANAGNALQTGRVQVTRDYSPLSNDVVMPVYLDELMPLVELRIAGFVRERLLDFREFYCPMGSTAESRAPETANCFPYAATTAEADNQQSNEEELSLAACRSGLQQGRLPITNGDCPASLSSQGMLQGTDLSRHWFIRNDWPAFFSYRLAADCVDDVEHRCDVFFELPTATVMDTVEDTEPALIQISVEVAE